METPKKIHPLDHDGDGRLGGSLPKKKVEKIYGVEPTEMPDVSVHQKPNADSPEPQPTL